jgi:hypothetical protein
LTGLKSVAVSSGVVVVPGRKKNEARYVTTETKTGRRGSGVLGIDDEFAKQIDKMWYQGMEEWFASPNKSPDHKFGDGYIFSDDFGETCWHPDTLTARLKRGRERALEQHPYGAILQVAARLHRNEIAGSRFFGDYGDGGVTTRTQRDGRKVLHSGERRTRKARHCCGRGRTK